MQKAMVDIVTLNHYKIEENKNYLVDYINEKAC